MVEIVSQESVKVYLHTYSGNVEQNPLCLASRGTKGLSICPRFSPTIFYRGANSVLEHSTFVQQAVASTRRTLSSKMFTRKASRSIYTCTTEMFSRTLYAQQHPVSLRIFPSLPGSRLRFFIARQIQLSTL